MKKTLGIALIALVLSGCGGDEDSDASSGEDSSQETIESALPTCEDVTAGVEPPHPSGNCTEASPTTTPEATTQDFIAEADEICRRFNDEFAGVPELTDAYVEAWRESDAELARLDVPPELEIQFRQYIAALEDQLAAAQAGDGGELRAADHRKEELARELGFAECGTG